MATKVLTTEAIALTEKKMDMSLDEIIKLSKKPANKDKKAPRQPVKVQGFLNGNGSQRGNMAQRFVASRSSIRQGVLAQKRSHFQGNRNHFPLTNNAAKRAAVMNHFPLTNNAAKRAAVIPIRNINSMPVRNTSGNRKTKPWLAPVNAQRKANDGGFAVKDTNAALQKQQRPQTMDALFADMKEKRMMVFSSQPQSFQQNSRQIYIGRQQPQQHNRGGRGFRSGMFPRDRHVENNNFIR